MDSPGWWAAIGCTVLLLIVEAAIWGIVSIAAEGLGRNRAAGIRLPSLVVGAVSASRAANSVPRDD